MKTISMRQWFQNWTNLKINIHTSNKIKFFREREVWWASIGANIGHEQNGKNKHYERPILIVKKFNKDMFWALPLTSKNKTNMFYYDLASSGFKSNAILSQLRLMSSKRIIRRLGKITINDFNQIKNKITALIK